MDPYFLHMLKPSLGVSRVTPKNNAWGADGDVGIRGVTMHVTAGANSLRTAQ